MNVRRHKMYEPFSIRTGADLEDIKRNPSTRRIMFNRKFRAFLAGAWQGPVALGKICTGLARGRNIFRAGTFKKLFCFLGPVRTVTVDGKQNAAFFHAAFVSFCFILGNAHADESSRDTADRATYSDTGQGSHNWSRGDKWPQSGNGQGADPCEPTQTAADHRACAGSRRGAFRSFGALFMRVVFCAFILWKQYRDIRVAKSFLPQSVNGIFYADAITIYSKRRCVFSCHANLL